MGSGTYLAPAVVKLGKKNLKFFILGHPIIYCMSDSCSIWLISYIFGIIFRWYFQDYIQSSLQADILGQWISNKWSFFSFFSTLRQRIAAWLFGAQRRFVIRKLGFRLQYISTPQLHRAKRRPTNLYVKPFWGENSLIFWMF